MAKKTETRLAKFLKTMSGTFVSPRTVQRTTLNTDGNTTYSNAEKSALVSRLTTITNGANAKVDMSVYRRYMQPLTKQIAQLKLDNDTLSILAPEIKTAETIVIPSIMSPTDLRDGTITLKSTSKLVDDAVNERISALLHEHFNENFGLSDKLPEWIREALYGAGCKPILVLPITELDTIIDDPTAIQYKTIQNVSSATENFNTSKAIPSMESLASLSIFGVADRTTGISEVAFEGLKNGLENTISKFMKTLDDDTRTADPYNFSKKFNEAAASSFRDMVKRTTENVSIIDNPDVLKLDKAQKATASANFKQKIITHYKTKSIISFTNETKESVGNPIVYELPPESVIPIFTPGTPTDHIGYFIVLDEHGNPVELSEDLQREEVNNTSQNLNSTTFYKAMGLDAFFGHGKSNRAERDAMMANIYQNILESHLKSRLKTAGVDNTYIGAPESVYRCMFSRYLAARKTKLLFVPKDFMTYFCFNYNKNGTGRSQLENIKFTLSLKITLLICRMMAAMNSSIDRRTINVQFDEKMGDPIQYIELIQKAAIDKALVNFTYNPADISRTMAQRAISVKARGIPGAENFDITSEPNEIRSIKPDESLASDIDNMMILGLDVPPSAMNMLSENEFSRSVATNNLFFSRRILGKQIITCNHTENYVQSYVSMSGFLKDRIKDILQIKDSDKSDTDATKESGTVDDTKINTDALIEDIISHIKASLPAPDVAPNKTEFDELDALIQAMSTALENIFDNDMASDDPVPVIRSIVKSDLIRQFMSRIGVAKDMAIPEIDTALIQRCMEARQQLANITKGLEAIKSKTDNTATPDDTSTGGAPPSF